MYVNILALIPMHSPWSILSVFGIFYLLVCLLVLLNGVRGWLVLLGMAFCRMVIAAPPSLVGGTIDEDDSVFAQYIEYKGQMWNERVLIRESDRSHEVYYDPTYYKNEEAPRYYSMHVKGIPCWLFHPSSLYWCPLVCCLLGLIISPGWLLVIFTGSQFINRK